MHTLDRVKQCRNDQNAQTDQKDRIEIFADGVHNIVRTQCEEQYRCEEQRGKNCLRHRMTAADQRRNTHRKRGRRASWDRKERSDRQIECTGKEIAVPFGDSAGHLHQTAAAGDAERHNT